MHNLNRILVVTTWAATRLIVRRMIAARVVDFPEHAAPVTKTRPERCSASAATDAGSLSSSIAAGCPGSSRTTSANPVMPRNACRRLLPPAIEMVLSCSTPSRIAQALRGQQPGQDSPRPARRASWANLSSSLPSTRKRGTAPLRDGMSEARRTRPSSTRDSSDTVISSPTYPPIPKPLQSPDAFPGQRRRIFVS